jgi:hypothetical protein
VAGHDLDDLVDAHHFGRPEACDLICKTQACQAGELAGNAIETMSKINI